MSAQNGELSALGTKAMVRVVSSSGAVDAERNPLLHNLLSRFHELTGCPVLINTSFNRHEEPIVHAPEDAIAAFKEADLHALALGPFVVTRPGGT